MTVGLQNQSFCLVPECPSGALAECSGPAEATSDHRRQASDPHFPPVCGQWAGK